MLLVGITNKYDLTGEGTNVLKKILLQAPLEGLQEAGQEIIQAKSKNEDINWNNVITSAGIGTIIGGGATAVLPSGVEQSALPEENEQAPNEYNFNVRANRTESQEGLTQEKLPLDLQKQFYKQTGVSQEEFEKLEREQPVQKAVTDFNIVPNNTLPQEGITQELSPRDISKKKIEESRIERKKQKEKRKYDDYAFGELTRQFKNARRKRELIDEEELVNLTNNISIPEIKEKANKLIDEVKNSNKKIQQRSEFTLANLSQKRFGTRNLNSLDDEQQQNLLNEYNSMKKQGITLFKQPELVKPQLKQFESEVTDAVQKRSAEEILQRQPEEIDVERGRRGRVERRVQGEEVTEEEKGKPGREEEKEERSVEKETVPEEINEPEFTDEEIYDKAINLFELPPRVLNDNDIEEIKNELRKEKGKKVPKEEQPEEKPSKKDSESLSNLITPLEPERKELESKYGKLEDLSKTELKNIANRKESKETITPKVENVPISSIKTDEDRFQNRALTYSPRTVKAIEENYNPAKFDPVVLWKDPEDNNTYVLSGHSRLEGMKRRNAGNIPARYFEGSENEAIKFARLESNRSASKESLLEDIKAYKYAVENKVPKKELQETFPNGQYKALEDLSKLNGKGQFLSNLNSDNKEAFPYLERNARWVGQLRAEYPVLNDAHEDEMFDYFYREKNKNLRIKKDDFFNAVEKQVNRADFAEDKSLMLDSAGKTTGVRARADTADLQKQIDELVARKREAITDKERDALDTKIEKLKENIQEITSSQLTFLEDREKYGVQKPLSKEFVHEQLALFDTDAIKSDSYDYKNDNDSELEDQKIDGPYKYSFISLARMNLHYSPTPLQKTLGRYAFGYDLLILDNDLKKNDFKTISYKALKKAREAARYNLQEAPEKYSRDEISEIKNLRNYKKHLELVIPELEKQWFKNNGIEYNRQDRSFRQFDSIDYSRTKAVEQLREKWAGYGDKEAVRLVDAKSELYKTNKAIERLQKSVKEQPELKGQQDIFKQSKGEPEELFGSNVESELKPVQIKQEQLKLFEKNGRIRRSIYDRENIFGSKTQNKNALSRLQDDLENAKADIKFNVEYEGGLPKRTIPEEVRAVLKEFREKGEVSLIGLQLGSNHIQDIADAYKIFRDPFIEVAHIIGRDNNNKIVANVSYTSGASNYIYYRQSQFDDIIQSLKNRGAKKVTILHNHPSGNPRPSRADITLSSFLREKFKKGNLDLDSSVVIDGDKYSAWTLSDDAAIKPKMYRYKSPKEHPLEEFYKEFDSFPRIKLDSDIAPMYLAQLKYGEGNIAVVVADNNLRVRGYEYVHKNILNDEKRFSKYVDEVLKSHGGATAFIAGKEGDIKLPEVNEKPDDAGVYEAKEKKTLRSEYSYEPVKATIIYKGNDAVQVFEYNAADNFKLAERVFGEERREYGFTINDEAVENKNLLLDQNAYRIDSSEFWDGKSKIELRKKVREYYKALKRTKNKYNNHTVDFRRAGFNKLKSHSADVNMLKIIPHLDNLIENAIPIFSEANKKIDKQPNILRYNNYAIKSDIDGQTHYIRLVTREDKSGKEFFENFYDADVTASGEIEKGSKLQPDRLTKSGGSKLEPEGILTKWIDKVNEFEETGGDPTLLSEEMSEYGKKELSIDEYKRKRRTSIKLIKEARKKAKAQKVSFTDRLIVPITSRLEKLSPTFRTAIVDYEFKLGKDMNTKLEKASGFLRALQQVEKKKEDWLKLDLAMKNGKYDTVKNIAEKYGFEKELSEIRTLLDDIYKQMKESGFNVNYEENYFPRGVKELDPLYNYLQDQGKINQLDKFFEEQGAVTKEEKIKAINNSIRGFNRGVSLKERGNMLERLIPEISEDINNFYYPTNDAIVRYIVSTAEQIHKKDFFGNLVAKPVNKGIKDIREQEKIVRSLKRKVTLSPDANEYDVSLYWREYEKLQRMRKQSEDYQSKLKEQQQKRSLDRILLDESTLFNEDREGERKKLEDAINEFVSVDNLMAADIFQAVNKDQLDDRALKELRDILVARFAPGQISRRLAEAKALGYIALIGNPVSALRNIGDTYSSIYRGGLFRTIKNYTKSAVGKSYIDLGRDLGIEAQRIAAEFSDPSKINKVLRRTFVLTGFQKIDKIGKETIVNTVFDKYVSQSKRKKPSQEFIERLQRIFGNNYEQVLTDFRNRKKTEDTLLMVYSDLLDMQPLTQSNMPEIYLKAGNGRIFYQFKTFLTQRLDYFRNETTRIMFNPKSTTKQKLRAFRNLIKLTYAMVLTESTADFLIDWMLGYEPDDLDDAAVVNILGLFGMKKYDFPGNEVSFGGLPNAVQSLVENTLKTPLYPVDMGITFYKDIVNFVEGKPSYKSLKFTPVFGRILYHRYLRTDKKGRFIGTSTDLGRQVQLYELSKEKKLSKAEKREFEELIEALLSDGTITEKEANTRYNNFYKNQNKL